MCKASEGVYKKYKERKYGIRVCTGLLSKQKIDELKLNIDLLKYLMNTKNKCCDLDKLIENLT